MTNALSPVAERVLNYVRKCPQRVHGGCWALLDLAQKQILSLRAEVGSGPMLDEITQYYYGLIDEALGNEHVEPHKCLSAVGAPPAAKNPVKPIPQRRKMPEMPEFEKRHSGDPYCGRTCMDCGHRCLAHFKGRCGEEPRRGFLCGCHGWAESV